MKTRLLSFLTAAILFLFSVAAAAEETAMTEEADYSSLFRKDSIIDINISIDEKDLEDMYAYPKNEEYHSADITVAGIEMKNSGIRTKGNMTLSSVSASDSDRYSFRVKFNKTVSEQPFLLSLREACIL